MNKKEERLNQFGLLATDNTPMGIIGMEGNFFRGLAGRANRPVWLRVACILAALVFLVIPGIFVLVFYFSMGPVSVPSGETRWMDILLSLRPLGAGLFPTVIGIYIVISNLRRRTVGTK